MTVRPGGGTTQELDLNAGRLRAISVAEAGGEPVGGSWFTVYRETTNEAGEAERVKVASDGYTASEEFIIPAGDYLVHAKNKKRSSERDVTVEAAQTSEVEIVLD